MRRVAKEAFPPNQLIKPDNRPLTDDSQICLPSNMIPGFRHTIAVERGVNENILIVTAGGIGDVICAEPVIRFAIETFDCDVSIGSDQPELFQHLKDGVKNIFDLTKEEKPTAEDFYIFHTLYSNHFQHDFISPLQTHCVDYASVCAFRSQLPIASREVKLVPSQKDIDKISSIDMSKAIVIHAGRHWPTNTMPKPWWNKIIEQIKEAGCLPILIGKDVIDVRGTVDVDSEGCLDLRNKLCLMETVALLQRAKVFLTNDSSPLHMAVTGDAWIGFMATAKHPDHLTHWRKGEFGWRMKNFSLGGAWQVHDYCPNKRHEVRVDNLGHFLAKWLPDPMVVSEWALGKL